MAAPVPTGIEAVDRELERRAPFPSIEAAEATAAKLLGIWSALRPWSSDGSDATPDQKRQRER